MSIKTEHFESILEVLRNYPRGAKITEIQSGLSSLVPRRTLQRYMVILVKQGKVKAQGQLRGTRYFLSEEIELLPLSIFGKELKDKVNLPLQQRIPVSYNVDFLYSYQPNVTFYLQKEVREKLNKIGQQYKVTVEPGTYVNQIYQRMLIDLSWNSSRLEGNTYSLLETERLIEFGAEAEGKNALEAQMILNHKEAIEFLVRNANQVGFNKFTILNVHALLSNNLLPNPKARGALRHIPVGIGGTVYQPTAIPKVIDDCFQHILQIAEQIQDPFEQSFFIMVHIPYLQPFEDINKRVSRLSSNIPFIRHNLSPLSFIDVPKEEYVSGLLAIYELNKIELMRDVYIWAYERSASRYKVVQNVIGQPNILLMRYRKELFQLINHIVSENVRGKDILYTINKFSHEKIQNNDVEEFSRMAENEIMSLHEGNIAVYDISQDVYSRWKSG